MEYKNGDTLNTWPTAFIIQYKEIQHLLEIGSKNIRKNNFRFHHDWFLLFIRPRPRSKAQKKHTPGIGPLEQPDT